ncbi:putative disease resistance protein At1g50180 [Hibiscus syriacus]|uniref:putative disease resistance protein At1g50180 n=1 Tax=Hibiscus syriacus TaxID=106335 RepID=UPI001923147B|nr:putative disease resistance protein At1g50180 [Hibiscus syriacus]
MAVADAVISFAVEKTGDLILQQAKYLSSVSGKVKELQAELTRMRCFLRDAESKQGDSRSIRNWVAEIRDIAYDAEDVLEIYALKDASRNVFSTCGIRRRDPISVYKVGAAIDDIEAKLTKLTSRLPAYGLKELNDGERARSSSEKSVIRRSYSYKIEQNVVGLEEDAKLLLTQLERTDCKVVSICGMAGLGKTTLAKKVYHQCKVGHYFGFFIWIFVSQQWGKRNIWEKCLNELLSPEWSSRDEEFAKQWKRIQRMDDDGVAKMLHGELRKKKCLVVLDDIWDNAWNALSPGFPTEETSSKFIITTRNRSLAQGFIHEPRCLNDYESWELFTKTAIPTRIRNSKPAAHKIDERMEIMGKEMVTHCGGLPLAIVVLGGILKHKETIVEWETIRQCIKHYLKGEMIFQLLALSYDDLPYELKPCFLYLGMFPEDFQISGDRLINLWVAEGMIHPPRVERQGEEALEDIGYRYLTELAERYMIVVAERDSIGRIKK